MIDVKEFYDELNHNGVDFFAGVPDSLLKNICSYISSVTPTERNVIAANEGAAVALGAGYHLATNKIPLIYLQNSGLGNTVNPILSLSDKEVYAIPSILMIGWRGEPGVKDEPQHVKQGRVTPAMLDSMEIPYRILDADSDFKSIISELVEMAQKSSAPVALLVRKNTFSDFSFDLDSPFKDALQREEALEIVLQTMSQDAVIVSTTGKLSRELFELREQNGESHEREFLTVGSMGHTVQIALGIALAKPELTVYCFDGDGSSIMHLGSYAVTGNLAPKNLKIILFNNAAHDSVGGQPTVGNTINYPLFAESMSLDSHGIAITEEEIQDKVNAMETSDTTAFLEIQIQKGARKDLGRPTTTPTDNKIAFKKFIQGK